MAQVRFRLVCSSCGRDDQFTSAGTYTDCACGATGLMPNQEYELIEEDENNTSQLLEDADLPVSPVCNVINIGNTSLNGMDEVSDERLFEILLKRQQAKE